MPLKSIVTPVAIPIPQNIHKYLEEVKLKANLFYCYKNCKINFYKIKRKIKLLLDQYPSQISFQNIFFIIINYNY